MTSRLRARALTLGVTLIASLVFATACENPADPDAARVGDADISRDSLLETAGVYIGLAGDPYQLEADTQHAYTAAGLATVLSQQIADEIVLAAADRYGLEVDSDLVSQIDEQLSSPSSSGQVSPLNDLPADRRQAFIEARALETQLFDYVATNQWWNDEEAALFDELAADGTIPATSCVHHILVDTEAEANDILDELDGGADFEELAAERSTDTGSAQAGGDLGCNPAGTFVEPFEAALEGAKAGDVVGPVQTDFGYHVILVDTALDAPTIETAGADGWLEVLRRTTKVHVDPRYGTWDASSFSVTPPEGAAAPASNGLNFEL